MRRLLTSALILSACCCSGAPTPTRLFRAIELRGLAVPLYPEGSRQPCAILRADHVHTDYETKGFFRIGILPIEVMEGVSLEVADAGQLRAALAELQSWLGAKAAKRLELRGFKLSVASLTNHLQATRVRLAAAGRWDLLDGVTCFSGTNCVRATRATLQIKGEQAGQLVMETTPVWTKDLFAIPSHDPQPQQATREN